MLAELAEDLASLPEELSHSLGTADKLYKSEATDVSVVSILPAWSTKERQGRLETLGTRSMARRVQAQG